MPASREKKKRAAPRNTREGRIGKYELIATVAQGGMGTLYKARHPTLHRVVLLKKLTVHGGANNVERFRREARLMMGLKDERIVQVHDHFKQAGAWFIVEEFVDGISLDALIRRERYLGFDAAALILHEVCAALKGAHDKQVIHRDVKPANVLLSRQGQVKLADFGIATSRDEPDDGLTRAGTLLGTPSYMAPEQIEDPRAVDTRADIYSLGVVLYEMLTGGPPFPGTFSAETLRLIHKGKYVPAHKLNPRASPFLRRIARKCMRVKPHRRFRSVERILRLLERRMRRRDPASISAAVRDLVDSGKATAVFGRPHARLSRLAEGIACAVLVSGLVWVAVDRGGWYETAAASTYGALVVSLEALPDEPAAGQPVLYREDGASLQLIPGLDWRFHENTTLRTSDRVVLDSRTLFLRAGKYLLSVGRDGQASWLSFVLEPRVAQWARPETRDAQRIVVPLESVLPAPAVLRLSVRDAVSGADITSSAELSFLVEGTWVPADPHGTLATGGRERVRISCSGYDPEEFAMDLRGAPAVVRIAASLSPRKDG